MHTSWFDTRYCQARNRCGRCRARNAGRWYREQILEQYPDTPPGQAVAADFGCPYGELWREDHPRNRSEIVSHEESAQSRYEAAVRCILAVTNPSARMARMQTRAREAEKALRAASACGPCRSRIRTRFLQAYDVVNRREERESGLPAQSENA